MRLLTSHLLRAGAVLLAKQRRQPLEEGRLTPGTLWRCLCLLLRRCIPSRCLVHTLDQGEILQEYLGAEHWGPLTGSSEGYHATSDYIDEMPFCCQLLNA